MNTRINLYRDEFKPQFVWVSATNTIVFGVIALLIMSGAYFGFWKDQQSRMQELSQVQSSIKSKQRQLEDLTKTLTLRQKNPVLSAKLVTQKMRLSTAKYLADKLKNLSKLQEKPFSTAFTSFAEVNNSNVWLTTFKVNETEIIIEGNINQPDALPSWLKSIGKTDFFNNRNFGAATVFRTEEQLSFKIESKMSQKQVTRGETNE
ncbi:MAG: Tfp pilus assembly protein PilN [Glaciecola sp.]|jgi:Tfp pilus assembly protein PilN